MKFTVSTNLNGAFLERKLINVLHVINGASIYSQNYLYLPNTMKLAEKLGQCKYYDNCAIFSAQMKVG